MELGPPPRPLGAAHSLRPSPADEALDPLPRLDVGSPRCRPLETSVDGLTDQIGFRDAVPAGAVLEQTVLAGPAVHLLASHSWPTRTSAFGQTSEHTSEDPDSNVKE